MATKTEVRTTPSGTLAEGRRADIIADLNANLAYLTDLHDSAKQAHWNAHGPNFVGLHQLFDTIAFASRDHSDLVAERVLALGGTAHGTIADVAKMTEIEPFPTDEHGWEELTCVVHDRPITIADRMRRSATSMDDEQVTQDIYIEVIRGLEKWAWMLEAHLS